MAKIDCSVTVNFFKECRRMCDSFCDCSSCTLGMRDESGIHRCKANNNPEFAVEIVQKWSDEHPVKTRLDDVKERYPNIPTDDGVPIIAPWTLGYCQECENCSKSNKIVPDCWHEPVDGGATGKAVE